MIYYNLCNLKHPLLIISVCVLSTAFLIINVPLPIWIFSTVGVHIARKIDKMGMWSSDTAEVFFDDVHVPCKNIIGQEGMGFTYQMLQFQEERLWAVANSEWALLNRLHFLFALSVPEAISRHQTSHFLHFFIVIHYWSLPHLVHLSQNLLEIVRFRSLSPFLVQFLKERTGSWGHIVQTIFLLSLRLFPFYFD